MLMKDLSKEAEATLCEMLDYLCSKVNFGQANLDAKAVQSMNILFIELKKDKRKFELT